MQYQALKKRHEKVRANQDQRLATRIHRSLSWLKKAELEPDHDSKFIFLWISFNSAYASELYITESEKHSFNCFIDKIVGLDQNNRLYKLLFNEFSGLIRVLIDNKFIYEPFWAAMRTHDSSEQWKISFDKSKRLAFSALMNKKTDIVLKVVFDRLYVLRNQLFHGGATWESHHNRQQVIDGTTMLQKLIPVMISLMIEETEFEIGDIVYPVVA